MDAVLDSGGLSAWARRKPPAELLSLLEVAARSGGVAVVPTVTVAESTTGRPVDDARINQLLRRAVTDDCTLGRARGAAVLRHRCARAVSAVDAIVAATATARPLAAVATSDPADLGALLDGADRPVPVVAV